MLPSSQMNLSCCFLGLFVPASCSPGIENRKWMFQRPSFPHLPVVQSSSRRALDALEIYKKHQFPKPFFKPPTSIPPLFQQECLLLHLAKQLRCPLMVSEERRHVFNKLNLDPSELTMVQIQASDPVKANEE